MGEKEGEDGRRAEGRSKMLFFSFLFFRLLRLFFSWVWTGGVIQEGFLNIFEFR